MAAASAAAATGGALACIGLENPSRSSAQAAQKSRAWQTKLSQAARKARPAWHWLRSSFPAIQQLLTSRYNCSFYHSLMWAAGRCVCFCTCSETCTAPCHHPARCRLAAATPMHTLEQKPYRLRALFVGASRRSLFKLLQHQLTHASRGPGHFKRGAGPDPRGCWAARGEACWALELLGHQQRRRRHFRHLQHQPSSPANPLALQAPPPAVAPAPSPARQAAHQQAAAALGAALVSLAAACAPAPAAAADLKLGQEVFEANCGACACCACKYEHA